MAAAIPPVRANPAEIFVNNCQQVVIPAENSQPACEARSQARNDAKNRSVIRQASYGCWPEEAAIAVRLHRALLPAHFGKNVFNYCILRPNMTVVPVTFSVPVTWTIIHC